MAKCEQIKPWGFWKPIHEKVLAEHPEFKRNTNFKKDMFNVFIGTIWQTALVAFPIYLVFHMYSETLVCLLIAGVLTVILKRNWWDRLHEMDDYEQDVIKI